MPCQNREIGKQAAPMCIEKVKRARFWKSQQAPLESGIVKNASTQNGKFNRDRLGMKEIKDK
jgi:hypothetical protein